MSRIPARKLNHIWFYISLMARLLKVHSNCMQMRTALKDDIVFLQTNQLEFETTCKRLFSTQHGFLDKTSIVLETT